MRDYLQQWLTSKVCLQRTLSSWTEIISLIPGIADLALSASIRGNVAVYVG